MFKRYSQENCRHDLKDFKKQNLSVYAFINRKKKEDIISEQPWECETGEDYILKLRRERFHQNH